MNNEYPTREAAVAGAEEESKRMIEDFSTITFEGHNCSDVNNNDTCEGWDGNSHRCECTNRRVTWEFERHNSGLWYYYAAAY